MKKFLILLAAASATLFSLSTCSKDALWENCMYSKKIADIDIDIDVGCKEVPVTTCAESASTVGLGLVKGRVVDSCDDFNIKDANKENCKVVRNNIVVTCEKDLPKGACDRIPDGEVVDSCGDYGD
jgi:hypothetical protein